MHMNLLKIKNTSAQGIILCHNYISGNLQPSSADIEITK